MASTAARKKRPSSPPADVPTLQRAARDAIEKHGLEKAALAVEVGTVTLQRFAYVPGASHKGTIALVDRAYREGKLS